MGAEDFDEFLANPSADTYLRLREQIVAAPKFDFYSSEVDDLEELLAEKTYPAVFDLLPTMMPAWLLSPRVHSLVGQAATETGDADRARFQDYLAQACMRGMLLSGKGTPDHPYRVTHLADEYDVLEYLEKEAPQQRLVTNAAGRFDVFTSADSSEVWFEAPPGL